MFKYLLPREQGYAFVPDIEHPETNRYGKSIETVPEGHELRGQSLNINGDASIGENPNRSSSTAFISPQRRKDAEYLLLCVGAALAASISRAYMQFAAKAAPASNFINLCASAPLRLKNNV